jgi:hypothetical protein
VVVEGSVTNSKVYLDIHIYIHISLFNYLFIGIYIYVCVDVYVYVCVYIYMAKAGGSPEANCNLFV